MSFKPRAHEPASRPYPEATVVDVALSKVRERQVLEIQTLRLLGDIPLRTLWWGTDWERALTTSLQGVISLPDLSGSAIYIRPDVRRFCALLDEASLGIWDSTVIVGASTLQRTLLDSPDVRLYCPPQVGIRLHDGGIEEGFGLVTHAESEPGLQLVCFDAMGDATDEADALAAVKMAAAKLDDEGLLIIGGTVHTSVGRQCLSTTVDAALDGFDLQYEQEATVDGARMYQAVFSK